MEFEAHVTQVRTAILEMARQQDIPSAVLVAALSDVLGYTARVLDLHTIRQPIERRLVAVEQRVKQAYGQAGGRG